MNIFCTERLYKRTREHICEYLTPYVRCMLLSPRSIGHIILWSTVFSSGVYVAFFFRLARLAKIALLRTWFPQPFRVCLTEIAEDKFRAYAGRPCWFLEGFRDGETKLLSLVSSRCRMRGCLITIRWLTDCIVALTSLCGWVRARSRDTPLLIILLKVDSVIIWRITYNLRPRAGVFCFVDFAMNVAVVATWWCQHIVSSRLFYNTRKKDNCRYYYLDV